MTELSTRDLPARRGGLILQILLPMGTGYFLSYFFRNVNGPIAGELIRETGIGAGGLGLLTGLYFAAFTLSQLPLGNALDKFGPRRVQATLLAVAALGALVFSLATDGATLAVGRFLIGLGTAGCLMAGLKATMQWSGGGGAQAKSALSAVNGIFMMFGGVGAMAATVPMSSMVALIGWRATFQVLAAAALLLALVTLVLVPEAARVSGPAARRKASLAGHPANGMLWALAPMSALTFGTVSAFQGLWASRWFSDVGHLPPDQIALQLLVMAATLTLGAPLMGFAAAKLRGRIDAAALAIATAITLVVVEALICARMPLSDLVLWPALSVLGAVSVASYGVLSDFYPAELIGRANAVLNTWHTASAFAMQFAIGLVVNLWPAEGGAYPVAAYQSAFVLIMACQVVAIAMFAAKRTAAAAQQTSVQEAV
jgi:MFS family permease